MGKKTQIAGFFTKTSMRPKESYRIFNTWMGDPSKMLMLESVLKEYQANDLVENARITGDYLLEGVKTIQDRHPRMLSSARGKGTFVAVSAVDSETRDKLVSGMRQRGVQCGGSGAFSIRLRPAMVFMPHHCKEFLTIFDEVCTEVQEASLAAGADWSDFTPGRPRNIVDVDTGKQGTHHSIGELAKTVEVE